MRQLGSSPKASSPVGHCQDRPLSPPVMRLTLCGHRALPSFRSPSPARRSASLFPLRPFPRHLEERKARVMWTLCALPSCAAFTTRERLCVCVSWRTPFEAEKNEIVLQGAGADLAIATAAQVVDKHRSERTVASLWTNPHEFRHNVARSAAGCSAACQ